MCTAITYTTRSFYFGRTLDLDCSYGEEVVITPRCFPFPMRKLKPLRSHYAMIGMAHVSENYPLYYDAINERGLAIAGLDFTDAMAYQDERLDRNNVTQFELLPYILGQCSCVRDARELLGQINLIGLPFNDEMPPAQLHWLLSDRKESITVESVKEGLHIYDNPVGVLTNKPTFPELLFQLNNYMSLSPCTPQNTFAPQLTLQPYSLGMGAIGLPGDLSSQSRFVRASFTKFNSCSCDSETESVTQFFHILDSVSQTRGCAQVSPEKFQFTVYSSCCNAERGIYYYTTYQNRQITAVDMHRENLDGTRLSRFPLILTQQFRRQN